MSFQQFLQTEIQPQRTVTGPDAGSLLASAVSTGMNVFQQVQETGQKNKFASEVQRIVNLNEDLVGSNVPQVKRNQRLREEIANSFPEDPASNLELRKALGSFGISAGLAVGRSGAGAGLEAPVDIEEQDAIEKYSQVPSSFAMMYIDPKKPLDTTSRLDVVKKYQKHLVDQQEAQDLIKKNTGNQIADAVDFGVGQNQLFETFVGPSIKVYEKELDSIDLSSSQGVARLEALRVQGLNILSNFEQQVAVSYSNRLAQLTDKDAISLLEKRRDAQFDTIKRIRDNLFSPDSQLDVDKQRLRFLNTMTSNYKMNNADAVAVLEFARGIFGEAGMASLSASLSAGMGEFFGEGGAVQRAFESVNDNLKQVVLDPLNALSGGNIDDVINGYKKVRDVSNGTLGTGDEKAAINAYSSWLATSNRMLSEGAHVDDLEGYLKDSESWNAHWEMLSPEQNETVKARQDVLRYRIVTHQDSWLNSEAMDSGLVQWSPKDNKFVAKQVKGVDENLQPPVLFGLAASPGYQGVVDNQAIMKVREFRADKYNKRLEDTLQSIIRRRKRETGQDITREQALQYIPALRKPVSK